MSAETYSETYAEPSKPVRVIDVSAIQGGVRWGEVASAGIMGAVLKCTEGMRGTDRMFAINAKAARDAGIAIGAYHFGKPATDPGVSIEKDAQTEACRFFELCDALGSAPGEIPPVLDIEVMDNMAPSVVAQWIRVWLDQAEQLFTRVPVIYTGLPMAQALRLVPTATRYPLWIARYVQNMGAPAMTWEQAEAFGSPLKAKMMQPLPWAPCDLWKLWQFSGGGPGLPGNRVPGIDVEVDCNRFNGNENDWVSFLAA